MTRDASGEYGAQEGGESRLTVLLALGANTTVAVAKTAACPRPMIRVWVP